MVDEARPARPAAGVDGEAAVRPADDEHRGACVARLARGDGALLVAHCGAGGADAGDDEKAVAPLLTHRTDLVPRTDDAVETGLMRQLCQSQHVVVRASRKADPRDVGIVEAGEHGDRDDLGVRTGGRLGILHHRAATGGMDGDDSGFEHMDGLHRGGDGVGDVMQLEVEKDRQADLRDLVHAVMAMRAEEFQPQLHPADMSAHLLHQSGGAGQIGKIDREIDGIGHDGKRAPVMILQTDRNTGSGSAWSANSVACGGADAGAAKGVAAVRAWFASSVASLRLSRHIAVR